MSRSNYNDDCEQWALICWRGAVTKAIKGKRGQQLLIELAAALDAMPNKRLIQDELEHNGEVCALGALGKVRSMELSKLDPYDAEGMGRAFGVAPALIREIEFENDEEFSYPPATPEQRWVRMRRWVKDNIAKVSP